MSPAETEALFVTSFLLPAKRERWLSLLPSEKSRIKLISRLAHDFSLDLDPRFTHPRDAVPPAVAAEVRKVTATWTKTNTAQLCHLIANSKRDGQSIPVAAMDADAGLTFGAVVILIPDRLAYYLPERSNLEKQPALLLYRAAARAK